MKEGLSYDEKEAERIMESKEWKKKSKVRPPELPKLKGKVSVE